MGNWDLIKRTPPIPSAEEGLLCKQTNKQTNLQENNRKLYQAHTRYARKNRWHNHKTRSWYTWIPTLKTSTPVKPTEYINKSITREEIMNYQPDWVRQSQKSLSWLPKQKVTSGTSSMVLEPRSGASSLKKQGNLHRWLKKRHLSSYCRHILTFPAHLNFVSRFKFKWDFFWQCFNTKVKNKTSQKGHHTLCRPAYEVQMCWKCQNMSAIAL